MPGRSKGPKSTAKQTIGTRRGNGSKGPGWGGPAQGAGNAPGDGTGGGRPEGVKHGEGKRAQARAALEDAAPLAVQTLIDVAKDVADQRAVAAAVAILNRVGLHEKSGVEVTGANGPVELVVRIVDADEPGPESQASVSPVGPD